MQLRPGIFSLDDGPSYPGYTTGRTWNGWAQPYFTQAVPDQLAAQWNVGTMSGTYHATTDTYTFCDPDNDMEPESFSGQDHEVDGQPIHLYPIGNGSWVWDEV